MGPYISVDAVSVNPSGAHEKDSTAMTSAWVV